MNRRNRDKLRREQLHREIEEVWGTLEAFQPMGQEERAELARSTRRLIHTAFELGDDEARSQALALDGRAQSVAFPTGFWESYERLRAGDPAGLEVAVKFLEDDPWFFRSGYAKERLLRHIKRIDIPERYLPRLERVLLNAVDSRKRREFRQFCHLARELGGESLRRELQERLASDDPGVRRRAGWMLDALDSAGT